MSFRKIEKDIKSAAIDKPEPVLLFGEERFLVNYYEKQLTALFAGAMDGDATLNDLDVSVFYGDEAGDDDIMAALDTYPMFLPARIVIVRSHPDLSSPKAGAASGERKKKPKHNLADYSKQIPPTSRLILTSVNVNKTRALYKAVAKYGTAYEFTRLDEADLQAFVRKRLKKMGADITADVLDAFTFTTGYLEKDSDKDLFMVENDVYKLASYVIAEGRTEITHSDIEECLEGVLRIDAFAMLDAISAGKKAEAINLLENSMAGGESAFRLLALFTVHFEIMLGFMELSAQGHSSGTIAQILGEKSDWRVKKLGGFARRFGVSKLRSILSRLYEVERQIKSGNLAERLALTILLAEI